MPFEWIGHFIESGFQPRMTAPICKGTFSFKNPWPQTTRRNSKTLMTPMSVDSSSRKQYAKTPPLPITGPAWDLSYIQLAIIGNSPLHCQRGHGKGAEVGLTVHNISFIFINNGIAIELKVSRHICETHECTSRHYGTDIHLLRMNYFHWWLRRPFLSVRQYDLRDLDIE